MSNSIAYSNIRDYIGDNEENLLKYKDTIKVYRELMISSDTTVRKLRELYSSELKNINIAVREVCTKSGINYYVVRFDEDGCSRVAKKTIEELYKKAEDYINVIVNGTRITIICLEGLYSYDINDVYATYNREVLESSRNIKALLVDPSYNETINASGTLLQLKCGKGVTKIASNVKSVNNRAIVIDSLETTGLIFGENILDCSKRCIDYTYNQGASNLNYIEIGCSKRAGIGVLNTLAKTTRLVNLANVRIVFKRQVTPEEYGYLIYNELINSVDNIDTGLIDDEYIVKAIKFIISESMDNFRLIKQYKDDDYSTEKWDNSLWEFRKSYRTKLYLLRSKLDKLIEVWDRVFKCLVSEELQEQLDKRLRYTRKVLSFCYDDL